MQNLRELLNSFTEDDFKNNKVNLHIHTACSDGLGNYEQIVSSAKEQGYRLIAITDHNSVKQLKAFREVAKGKIKILHNLYSN